MRQGREKVGFEACACQYSPLNAYVLAQMSKLAYQSTASIRETCDAAGFADVEFFGGAQATAFLAARDDATVLSFRGTADLEDVLADLNLRLVNGPLGRVHCGFWGDLEFIWPSIWRAIDARRKPWRWLWLTGHSLGASLATLAVAKLARFAQAIGGLYTYGSPRCGDAIFARQFTALVSRAYRHIYREDVVTRIPFGLALLDYRHVGQVKQIGADNSVCDSTGWRHWWREARHWFSDLRSAHRFEAIGDHHVDNYVRALGAQPGVGAGDFNLRCEQARA